MPPSHPFCRCKLVSRWDLDAANAREKPKSEQAFVSGAGEKEGIKIMGSRDRWFRVKNGRSVADVFNAHKDPMYHLKTVGEAGKMWPHLPDNWSMEKYIGQRPGLLNLPPVEITELRGDEFAAGLSHRQLTAAANEMLRVIQRGDGMPNDDTGWKLRINKIGRKKIGDNEKQSSPELMAVAVIERLAKRAVVAERHSDDEHRNPDVVAVFRLYAPVSINGVLYRAKLTVKDYGKPKMLHALAAVEIENVPLGTLPAYSGAMALQQGQPTTGRALSINDLMNGATLNNGMPFML